MKKKVGNLRTAILPEKETRKRFLARAKALNCEGDVIALFDKYDRALKNCTNEQERKHIATTGAAELYNFFYCRGGLSVNGEVVIPAEKGDENILDRYRKIKKID